MRKNGKNLYKQIERNFGLYGNKDMKNMIVLRNLPSNMVEEAFVVFKDNVKIHKKEKVEKNKFIEKEDRPKSKEYMIKEAEMIVQDYISRVEQSQFEIGSSNKKLREKYKRLKALCIFLGMFSGLSLLLILLR